MIPADLARRLAAHGLTLVRERHETHGYVAEWRLDGLGAPARFARWESVEAWAARWLGDDAETPEQMELFQDAA